MSERHVRERRLAPTRRNVQVIDELTNGLTDFAIIQLVKENIRRQIGVKRAERLSPGPFRLQDAQSRHLTQRFAEMARRTAGNATLHTIETFAQQLAQAPPGAITGQAVQIMDVIIAFAMCFAFGRAIDFIQPIIPMTLPAMLLIKPAWLYPTLAFALIRQSALDKYSATVSVQFTSVPSTSGRSSFSTVGGRDNLSRGFYQA